MYTSYYTSPATLCFQDVEPLTLITRVQAVDPDFQLNGIVVYTFENLTLTKGPFQIDRESGEVRVRSGVEGRLDRETIPSYDVSNTISACLSLYISLCTRQET